MQGECVCVRNREKLLLSESGGVCCDVVMLVCVCSRGSSDRETGGKKHRGDELI